MKEIAPAFIKSVMGNTEFNKSTDISSYPYNPPEPDPRATEDCLFLDVVVPEKIFDRAQNKTSVPKSSLAPVLVWIYGGAYIGGEKSTDASGLVNRSMHGDAEGVVYVALNYRVSRNLLCPSSS
jgi:carboxylesterase type B